MFAALQASYETAPCLKAGDLVESTDMIITHGIGCLVCFIATRHGSHGCRQFRVLWQDECLRVCGLMKKGFNCLLRPASAAPSAAIGCPPATGEQVRHLLLNLRLRELRPDEQDGGAARRLKDNKRKALAHSHTRGRTLTSSKQPPSKPFPPVPPPAPQLLPSLPPLS